MKQPTNHPTDRPFDRSIDRPTDKPTNQPTNPPTNRLTDKPTNQLIGRPTDQPPNRPQFWPYDHINSCNDFNLVFRASIFPSHYLFTGVPSHFPASLWLLWLLECHHPNNLRQYCNFPIGRGTRRKRRTQRQSSRTDTRMSSGTYANWCIAERCQQFHLTIRDLKKIGS